LHFPHLTGVLLRGSADEWARLGQAPPAEAFNAAALTTVR